MSTVGREECCCVEERRSKRERTKAKGCFMAVRVRGGKRRGSSRVVDWVRRWGTGERGGGRTEVSVKGFAWRVAELE